MDMTLPCKLAIPQSSRLPQYERTLASEKNPNFVFESSTSWEHTKMVLSCCPKDFVAIEMVESVIKMVVELKVWVKLLHTNRLVPINSIKSSPRLVTLFILFWRFRQILL